MCMSATHAEHDGLAIGVLLAMTAALTAIGKLSRREAWTLGNFVRTQIVSLRMNDLLCWQLGDFVFTSFEKPQIAEIPKLL